MAHMETEREIVLIGAWRNHPFLSAAEAGVNLYHLTGFLTPKAFAPFLLRPL